MRDYFATIVNSEVPGVMAGDSHAKGKATAHSRSVTSVTYLPTHASDAGDMSPAGTRVLIDGVTTKATVTAALPPSPYVTPDMEEWQYYFEERAGIYEFDASHARAEAERLAYLDVLHRFMIQHHPDIDSMFHQLIGLPTIH